MTTLPFAGLTPEGIRVMRDVLAEARRAPEQEWSEALRTHEVVRRWWQGVGAALSRGVEGSQARAFLSSQIAFCEADAIFLRLALDNAANAPHPEDVERVKAALAEAGEIETRARQWLDFLSEPPRTPSEEQFAHGKAAYERGETVNLREAAARLRGRRP